MNFFLYIMLCVHKVIGSGIFFLQKNDFHLEYLIEESLVLNRSYDHGFLLYDYANILFKFTFRWQYVQSYILQPPLHRWYTY